MEILNEVIRYEDGEMDDLEIVEFFQKLYDTGAYLALQGHYQRTLAQLIRAGLVDETRAVV